MKQDVVYSQAGFSLVEVLVAVALVAVISAAAVPSLLSFYRQYAVEYESDHLLADVRRAQSITRTAAPAAQEYGAHSKDGQGASILIERDSYLLQVGYNDDAIRIRHYYLPLVRVLKDGKLLDYDFIFFEDNGRLRTVKSTMTLQVFCEGHLSDGRQIKVSRGGRIRIERGDL